MLHSQTHNSRILADSLAFAADSIPSDSIQSKIDTTLSKDAIESRVDYRADDSMRIDMESEKVYLFGNAQVNYELIQLNAAYIELDLKNNMVMANGVVDSTGKMTGLPVFKEGAQTYEAGKMTYNFETEKGKIQEIKTQEGDGYIKGNEVKKTDKDIMYVRNGYYTTCSHPEPHFSLATSKLKVIPDDKIVTGPTVLKVGDVPTPLGLPFGFFPNKKGRSSGIIIPTYGDSRNLGFFLRDGGFYWGASDNIDVALTADIYSLGSWGANFNSRYIERYKYNGNLNFTYANIRNSYPEFPDYRQDKEFFIRWNHAQDARARPGGRFNANVGAGTNSNFRRNLNSFAQDYLTTTFNSSINYTNSFPGRPYNLTVSARHDQNTQTSRINFTLPEVSFNVSRQYPLKGLGGIGNEWWRSAYKNLGIWYNGSARNTFSAIDTNLALNRLDQHRQDFRNGATHSIPIATNIKMFKYFNMTPQLNYTEIWATRGSRRFYDPETRQVVTDTINDFFRAGTYNFNTSLTTKLYGMYQFRGNGVQAIRHVVTPQFTFNYQPEINTGLREYVTDEGERVEYSLYDQSLFGRPDRRESGRLGINLLNNIEMKVASDKDTTGLKKITLFDNIGLNTSYDLAADSLNWSNIAFNARSRIGQFLTFQLNGSLDPYAVDSNGINYDRSYHSATGRLLRLASANATFGFNLRGGGKKKGIAREITQPRTSPYGSEEEMEEINNYPEQFVDFNIPWSLNINYNIRYSKNYRNLQEGQPLDEYTQTLNFGGDFSLTKKWKIGFNSGWDFEREDLTYTALNINRDLHCWQMAISWIPKGPRQSYMVTINVKSPVLQDLKLNRRRDYYDVIR
jgi:lipopolysaccharide assembly outer membrane protein LptD (OstA)